MTWPQLMTCHDVIATLSVLKYATRIQRCLLELSMQRSEEDLHWFLKFKGQEDWILIRLSDSQQLLKRDKSQSRKWADENSLKQSYEWKQGGLATAFDLAAFRLSMIARVKKSVNHSRTVASMRGTGCEQQQEFGLRSDSRVWSEFAFGAVGHCFLCYNQFFFSAVM